MHGVLSGQVDGEERKGKKWWRLWESKLEEQKSEREGERGEKKGKTIPFGPSLSLCVYPAVSYIVSRNNEYLPCSSY